MQIGAAGLPEGVKIWPGGRIPRQAGDVKIRQEQVDAGVAGV
jgi:hypothetical protein